MAEFSFPTSPSLNQTYTFQGKTWKYNGVGWALVTNVDAAQLAWNTANLATIYATSADTLAQSAYDTANTKFSTTGGTITGNTSIFGNLTVSGNISYTGNVISTTIRGNTGQFFGFTSNGFNAIYAGIPSGYLVEPQMITQFTANYDGYAGVNHQNINSGTLSSVDAFFTPDNGSVNDTFLDLGMASSTYNYPGYTMITPNDGYLIAYGNTETGGGNMIVATGLNNDIIFTTGGVNIENEMARFKDGVGLVLKTLPITFADGSQQNTAAASLAYSTASFDKANLAYTVAGHAVNSITGGSITGNISITGNLVVTGANVALGNVGSVHIYGGNTGQILVTDSQGNLSFIDLPTTNTTTYTASTLTLTNGVYVSGSVTDTQVLNDGNYYAITDGSNTGPAWIITTTFTGVTAFNRLVTNIDYTAASGHTIYFQIYNYVTSTWDNIGSYSGASGYSQYALEVLDYSSYISGGTVQARLYHSNAGNVLHATHLDYIALQLSSQGAQGPRGATGATGSTGAGVATGGTAGQVLVKNSSTNYDTSWSSDLINAYAIANAANTLATSGYAQANAANTLATSSYSLANNISTYSIAGYAQANAANTLATSAYIAGNTNASNITATNTYAVSAYGQANSANTLATSSYNASNTNASNITATNTYAVSGYNQANAANTLASSAYVQANAANNLAASAYNQANAANTLATSSYSQANAANTLATSSYSLANNISTYSIAGYAQANAANTLATSAYNAGNTNATNITATNTFAAAAFSTANASNTLATSAYQSSNAVSTYSQAAYALANTSSSAITVIQGVDNTQNTNITLLQGAMTTANANIAYILQGQLAQNTIINNTANIASGAFTKANGAVQTGFTTISANGNSIASTSNNDTLTITSAAANGINILNPSSKTIDIGLRVSGVTAGGYGNTSIIPSITVDAFGRVTNISNNTIYVPPGTTIVANTGQLTANAATGTVALGLATTSVTPGTYGGTNQVPVLTIDAYGRITAASNTASNTSSPSISNVLVETIDVYTGDNSTVLYTLSVSPVSKSYTLVNIDGITQQKSTYSVIGNQLTFSTAPPTGSKIEVMTTTSTSGAIISLTDFGGSNNAIYSSSANTLVAGTLPVVAGGTGVTTSSGANSVVLRDSNQNISSVGQTTNVSTYLTSTSYTTSSTSQVTVDSFATATYRSAKYEAQMTSGTSYHVIEMRVLHDGTNPLMAQYGEIITGSSLGTFDVSISSGNVNLLFTPTNSVTTVKLVRQNIVV